MGWVVSFVGEVVLWGVGAVVVLVISFGMVKPAPVSEEFREQHPHTGRMFYVHDGQRYVSTWFTQTVGAVALIAVALALWNY